MSLIVIRHGTGVFNHVVRKVGIYWIYQTGSLVAQRQKLVPSDGHPVDIQHTPEYHQSQ